MQEGTLSQFLLRAYHPFMITNSVYFHQAHYLNLLPLEYHPGVKDHLVKMDPGQIRNLKRNNDDQWFKEEHQVKLL